MRRHWLPIISSAVWLTLVVFVPGPGTGTLLVMGVVHVAVSFKSHRAGLVIGFGLLAAMVLSSTLDVSAVGAIAMWSYLVGFFVILKRRWRVFVLVYSPLVAVSFFASEWFLRAAIVYLPVSVYFLAWDRISRSTTARYRLQAREPLDVTNFRYVASYGAVGLDGYSDDLYLSYDETVLLLRSTVARRKYIELASSFGSGSLNTGYGSGFALEGELRHYQRADLEVLLSAHRQLLDRVQDLGGGEADRHTLESARTWFEDTDTTRDRFYAESIWALALIELKAQLLIPRPDVFRISKIPDERLRTWSEGLSRQNPS